MPVDVGSGRIRLEGRKEKSEMDEAAHRAGRDQQKASLFFLIGLIVVNLALAYVLYVCICMVVLHVAVQEVQHGVHLRSPWVQIGRAHV